MTTRAPNWFEVKYIKGAIHVLQTDGYLTRGMAAAETNVKGITVTWRLAGAGTATPMNPAAENRPTMNADRFTVSGTMADYEANEEIQIVDIEKMSENEQQIAQQTAGYAMGRKFDQTFLGTMDAATTAITNQGNGSAAISITDLLQAQGDIRKQGLLGSPEIYCMLPFAFMNQLELFREFSSADYVGPDYPLRRSMGARMWRGMTIIPAPDSYFNVPSANQADGYMWIKAAMGQATNYDLISRIDYLPRRKTWFAGNTMGWCNAVLQAGGLRRLRFSTNTALTRPTP